MTVEYFPRIYKNDKTIETAGADDAKISIHIFTKETGPWAYGRVVEIPKKSNKTRNDYLIYYEISRNKEGGIYYFLNHLPNTYIVKK